MAAPPPELPALPPASGAWQEADPVGRRRFVDVGVLPLERGGALPGVRVAYESWGQPSPERDNAVLVLHALTGDSHVTGSAEPGHPTAGWWSGLVGPGRLLDPARHWIICPNVLGGCQGTTGPATAASDGRAWGSRWPRTTVRDQVSAELRLADALGITRWKLVLGGSMGGMRALEWAVTVPERVAGLGLIASTAEASADQIGFTIPQLVAIRADPRWDGGDYYQAAAGQGPHVGLGIARRIAHLTYRSAGELDARFGRSAQDPVDPLDGGRWQVESYLDHHADKLAYRFDAGSYVALTEAMNSHEIGRARGGLDAALATITADTVVAGVDSDRLYPLSQQERLASGIPRAAQLQVIHSPFGHDAFLLESDQLAHALEPLV
ncbi:MAG: homoserine O-acetyltransferase [Mycobacterium sp.]|nr:homoserine O-acetyltransferase [Mycobacterium sp.]